MDTKDFVNDSNYAVEKRKMIDGKNKLIWRCPYFRVWAGMKMRCTNPGYQEKHPSYMDIQVCDDWLSFSNFTNWMKTQDYDGKVLDKDILSIFTDTKEYSPDNCAFISPQLNSYFVLRDRARGPYYLGVGIDRRKTKQYSASCNNGTGRSVFLGYFNTPEEAHKAWQLAKWEYGRELLSKQTDPRVIQAMHVILHKLGEDWSLGRITEKLV
jgi:hypothetical protein